MQCRTRSLMYCRQYDDRTLEQMRYREQSRIAEDVKKYTRCIFWLTVTVTIATVFNLGLAVGILFDYASDRESPTLLWEARALAGDRQSSAK